MTHIRLTYRLHNEVKEFGCIGWDIYNSWLPYNGTEPLKMVVTYQDGTSQTYTSFSKQRKERLGVSYDKIEPVINA